MSNFTDTVNSQVTGYMTQKSDVRSYRPTLQTLPHRMQGLAVHRVASVVSRLHPLVCQNDSRQVAKEAVRRPIINYTYVYVVPPFFLWSLYCYLLTYLM